MRLALFASGTALIMIAAPAGAADWPVLEPPLIRGAIYDWSGPYIGAHGGWGWGRASLEDGAASVTDDNPLIGIQVGYQEQYDNLVLGLEADASYAGKEIQWIGSLRGRIGLATDNVLLYATGGVAVMGSDALGEQELHPGWVVGGGAELGMYGEWTGRLEYLYYDFQDRDYELLGSPVSVGYDAHVLRAGINYRLP